MQLNHLLFTQAAVTSNITQVRAAFTAVNHGNGDLSRFRLERIALLPPDLQTLNRIPRRLLRVTQYHGNVVHARDGLHHLGMANQPLG